MQIDIGQVGDVRCVYVRLGNSFGSFLAIYLSPKSISGKILSIPWSQLYFSRRQLLAILKSHQMCCLTDHHQDRKSNHRLPGYYPHHRCLTAIRLSERFVKAQFEYGIQEIS